MTAGGTGEPVQSGRPGRPAANPQGMADAIRSYLIQAEADSALPLALAQICKRSGVAKSTLDKYKHDAVIVGVLQEIDAARASRAAVAQTTSAALALNVNAPPQRPHGGPPPLGPAAAPPPTRSDKVLGEMYERARQRAVWAMQRFIGHNRKAGHVSDLPRAVRDLDVALKELHAIQVTMRAAADEWLERGAGAPAAQEEQDGVLVLFAGDGVATGQR